MILQTNSTSTGLIAWFTRNHVSANLLMLIIVLMGLYSAANIKKTLLPELNINYVHFSMLYPGASPDEVEQGIVLKVEQAVKEVEGLKRITSTASDSRAVILFEAESGYDLNDLVSNIRNAVDGISTFPKVAEQRLIKKVDFHFQSIQLQVYGNLTEMSAKSLAEDVKRELLASPEISKVDILGARDHEISIEIADADLRKYGLNLSDVARTIANSSVNIPGGVIRSANGNLRLRTEGQAYNQLEFKRLVLMTFADGTRLRLGDVAHINDGFVENAAYSSFDRSYSLGLSVLAVGRQDIVSVTERVKEYVAEKQAVLPEGVKITYWSDATYYLQGRLDMMLKNLLLGVLLVFILLGLFMDLKIAFWVMAGLPVCFLGALILLPLDLVSVSINMISLFGFILVLGIVVDDAIVIGESVHRTLDKDGHSVESVIKGVKAVSIPATFGVLTSICAFVPTLFIDGSIGSFPAAAGYVVIFCLLFSLIESKLILPAHLNTMHTGKFRWIRNRWQNNLQMRCNALMTAFIQRHYRPFLKKSISHRYTTFSVFSACFILIIGLIAGGRVHYVMSPAIPSDYIHVNIEMARGTPESQTLKAIKQVEDALYGIEQEYLQKYQKTGPFIKHLFSYRIDDYSSTFKLELTRQETRQISSGVILKLWRTATGDISGARAMNFSDEEEKFGPDLSFNLIGDDAEQLALAAQELTEKLSNYNGVYDVQNGAAQMTDEINLRIKPGAEALGVSLASLGQQVRDAFYGAEVQRVQRGEAEVRVLVRYPKEHRASINYLKNMTIRTDTGETLPFSAVAEIGIIATAVENIRINSFEAVEISAYADIKQVIPSDIVKEITGDFFTDFFKRYPTVSYQLGDTTEGNMALEKQLGIAFTLSLLGIYVLLAIPLHSYCQPLIVMSVIPLGFIGAVIGHVVLGVTVSLMSILGIIALSGVVVNDSLILVYFINNAKASGESSIAAALDAGCQRFRAIIITSLTTFFGVLPMMLETSFQAQHIIPMAISLGFGIIFSTAITLILLPCLYLILDDIVRFLPMFQQDVDLSD